MGQPLDLLGQALGVEPLDGLDDPGVERAPPVLEQAVVGHLVREGVLEGVLEVGHEPRLVEELGGLQVRETAPQGLLGQRRRWPGAAARGTSLPMTEAAWSRRLASGGSRSMRAARTASTVAGTSIASIGRARRCAPRSPPRASVSTSVCTVSSRKNGFPSVRSMRSAVSRSSPGSSPRSAWRSSWALSGGNGSRRSWRVGRSCCPSRAGTRDGSRPGGRAGRSGGSRRGCRGAPASRSRPSGGPRPRGAGAGPAPRGARAA